MIKILFALCIWCCALGAAAQTTQVFVASPTGSSSDIMARFIFDRLESLTGSRFVIENRSAGFASTALDTVQQAKPDGNTILVTVSINLITRKIVRGTVSRSISTEVSPITMFASTTSIMVVNSELPVHTVSDLVWYAKRNPNLAYASLGHGTTQHLVGVQLAQQSDIVMIHVPYKNINQLLADVVSGRVPMTIQTSPVISEYVRRGNLRALAVLGPARLREMPTVPTSAEAGYADLRSVAEHTMHFPPGTPKSLVDAMYRLITRVVMDPGLHSKFDALGTVPQQMPADSLTKYIDDEALRLNGFLKENNLSLTQ